MSPSKLDGSPEKTAASCHSRYAPDTEARRHLESSLAGRQPALLFILGAGRNFLGKAVRQILPGTMTVVLQACTDFDENLVDPGDLYWSPESPYPLERILTAALASGKAAGGIALIEWPPAARGYNTELEKIRVLLHQALELYSSEAATSAYWGRRWIRNSIDFVCGEGPLALLSPDSSPLIIACAGPGLHDALPALRAARAHIRLWALASSHQALMAEGLEPDLLLGTDPGYWNGPHLAMAARQGSKLAATPSTRLGSAILDGRCPLVPLYTGLGFELDALSAAGDVPIIKASASGTAAGTALALASSLYTGPIYLCGFDLASKGLLEHASPYTFDILDELVASRQMPTLASRFIRIMDRYPEVQGSWRLSRAFSTYALDTAHSTASATAGSNIFRISNSPVDTRIKRISPEQLLDALSARQSSTSTTAEVQVYYRPTTPKARLKAMLERLAMRSQQAVDTLKECALAGLPVPRDTVLELSAFGGKGCSAAIASAARGNVSIQELRDAEFAVSSGLEHLAGGRS